MTTPRRFGTEEPWLKWIRENPRLDSRDFGLSITDSDLWVHRYLVKCDRVGTRELQHIMLLEWKVNGADVPFAQDDTLSLVDQMLRAADGKDWNLSGKRGVRRCRSWGVHVVQLSGADPSSSDLILWDRKAIGVPWLEELLRFERDPDTLNPRSDRRHHIPSVIERLQRRLFSSPSEGDPFAGGDTP